MQTQARHSISLAANQPKVPLAHRKGPFTEKKKMRGILGKKRTKGMSEKMDMHLERARLLFWWGLKMPHLSGSCDQAWKREIKHQSCDLNVTLYWSRLRSGSNCDFFFHRIFEF